MFNAADHPTITRAHGHDHDDGTMRPYRRVSQAAQARSIYNTYDIRQHQSLAPTVFSFSIQ